MSFARSRQASINVSPADVGRRVAIVAKQDGFGKKDLHAEGVLYKWAGDYRSGIVRLRTRTEERHGIRTEDIVTARVMNPEVSAFDMQYTAQDGWPPLRTQEIGGWVARASLGITDRGNSVRVTTPPVKVGDVLAEIKEWYGSQGLTPKLQVMHPSGIPELSELGWEVTRRGRLMTASVAGLRSKTESDANRADLDVQITESANPEWLDLLSVYRPETVDELDHVLAVPDSVFCYCRNSVGELLGIGRATQQGPWMALTVLDTKPQSRRSGVASVMTAQLAQWASTTDATDWYLQVFNDNAGARALYERYGFTTHHQYSYWTPNAT